MLIQFRCKCCEGICDEKFMEFSDFGIAAYANVEWSDETSVKPRMIKGSGWLRSETRPNTLEQRVIRVTKPFSKRVGEKFWCLYESALSNLNGWDEHPDEIEELALVQCKIQRAIEISDDHAWLVVKVVKCMPFLQVAQSYPLVKETSPITNEVYNFERFDVLEYGPWKFYWGDDQGNLGNWFLLKETNAGLVLIVFGEWNFHADFAYFGNVLVSDETVSVLNSWVKESV